MDYDQAIDYLLGLADLERDPSRRRAKSAFQLGRMRSFLDRLDRPDSGRRTIHVAGSKGKGSTASMLAAVLQAAGEKTGLYTSPHLHSFCERIAVDGEPIPEALFADLVARLQPAAAEETRLGEYGRVTTFEHLTALALLYFRERACTWQVVEVGLGGRLDATNAMREKDLCIVTPVSLEHTDLLGRTVDLVAAEKAGIIMPGTDVVIAPQRHPAAYDVLRGRAEERGCRVIDVAAEYRWQWTAAGESQQDVEIEGRHGRYQLRLPLLGVHQIENAATAIAGIEALVNRGLVRDRTAIEAGLAAVSWPGRMEVIHGEPPIVLDGAHNRDSAARLREGLEQYFSFDRLLLVVGISLGKDIEGIAREFAPIADLAVCTQSSHPRAAPPEKVAAVFSRAGLLATVIPDLDEALTAVRASAGPNDLVCVMGSLFVVADTRESLLNLPRTAKPAMV